MNENWFKEKSLWSRFRNAYLKNANFKKYWGNLEKERINNDLSEIIDFYVNSESYKMSSRFWNILNMRNIDQINKHGIEKYSQTVSLNYFTYTEFYDDRIKNIISKLKNINKDISKYDIFKKYEYLDHSQSINHNIILNLLYSYFKSFHNTELLKVFDGKDYLLSETPYIEIDNVKITQDRINSILEYLTIKEITKRFTKNLNILEIGAGSGRTTEAILAFEKDKIGKYFVVDIPPALYLSYLRIKNNFPQKKIDIAKNISSIEEIRNFINKNDVIFLLPHQLSLLEKSGFKIQIFVAVDCLHEMDKKTIKYYMDYADRLCEFFYFKIWNTTHVAYAFNNYLSAEDENSYQIKTHWERIFKNECIFPGNYFDFCFKIKK